MVRSLKFRSGRIEIMLRQRGMNMGRDQELEEEDNNERSYACAARCQVPLANKARRCFCDSIQIECIIILS